MPSAIDLQNFTGGQRSGRQEVHDGFCNFGGRGGCVERGVGFELVFVSVVTIRAHAWFVERRKSDG